MARFAVLPRVALVLALPIAAAASTSLRGTPGDAPAAAATAAEPPLPSAPQEGGAGVEQRNATLNTTAAVLTALAQGSGSAGGQCSLHDVWETCSSDGCKVLAFNMRLKSCGEYCAEAGLSCVAGWEDAKDGCEAESYLGCEAELASDDLICECQAAAGGATSALDGYESHFLYNCYEGHGGEPAGVEGLVVGSTEDCAWYCDQDWRCVGFVYMYSQQKCWTRRSIRLGECEVGTEGQENFQFDTFTRKSR